MHQEKLNDISRKINEIEEGLKAISYGITFRYEIDEPMDGDTEAVLSWELDKTTGSKEYRLYLFRNDFIEGGHKKALSEWKTPIRSYYRKFLDDFCLKFTEEIEKMQKELE